MHMLLVSFESGGNNIHDEKTAFLLLTDQFLLFVSLIIQKQPSRGVPRKGCSENMQQIYRRTTMPKYDFNMQLIEITLLRGYSPENLLHIFRTNFS